MAKICSADGEAGSRELGRIRDVIGLGAELDPDLLDDGEVLRKVNIGEVRAVDSQVRHEPGRVAEGERRGGGDRTGVELLRRSPLGDLGVQDREAAGSERVRGFQLLSALWFSQTPKLLINWGFASLLSIPMVAISQWS